MKNKITGYVIKDQKKLDNLPEWNKLDDLAFFTHVTRVDGVNVVRAHDGDVLIESHKSVFKNLKVKMYMDKLVKDGVAKILERKINPRFIDTGLLLKKLNEIYKSDKE